MGLRASGDDIEERAETSTKGPRSHHVLRHGRRGRHPLPRRLHHSRGSRSRLQKTASVFFRRKLFEQVRPVASDDAADLGVDFGNIVEAFLNLLAEHLELFRAKRAAV
jgi:hypothetical protein